MKKILIADDHEIFRKGIAHVLGGLPCDVSVDEAGNGQQAIELIWGTAYSVVLLDISMPGRNGIDILKLIKSFKPDVKVLILSMYPEEQFAVRALKAGADGYLTKAAGPDEVLRAVEKVLRGNKYITPSLAEQLACHIEQDRGRAIHETLSDREYEVLCMTATGKSVKQIAMELSLSHKTISTYRTRILSKMNMQNIAQLIQYAVHNRIVDTAQRE